MEGVYLERKCFYIGFWKDDTVADNIIRQVATKVRSNGGTKCKLNLSGDGLKVTTSSVMSGPHLKDVIPFNNIYFTTSNQYNPQCLLFIAKDDRRRYRITAFRCKTDTDVALFVSCFKDLRIARNGKGNNVELKQVEDGNWTLRAKNTGNDKRQLNKIVDIKSAKTAPIKQNGILKVKHMDVNSNVKVTVESASQDTDVNIRRKDSSEVAIQTTLAETNGEDSLHVNSSPGPELKDELSHLSQELRDIKFVLETSAGLGVEDKPVGELDANDNRIDAEIIEDSPKPPITTVLVEDKENDSTDKSISDTSEDEGKENTRDSETKKDKNTIDENLNTSKNTTSSKSSEGEIKVAVPDYRNSGTQSAPKYERRYIPKVNGHSVPNGDTHRLNGTLNSTRLNSDINSPRTNGEPISPRSNGELNSPRFSTTSYNTWKEDVVLRKNVAPRGNRPRSAYLSTSSYDSSLHGSLRDRDPHVIYATSRTHHTLPHHSLRIPLRKTANRSSTIERPIEKVYPRPKSVHGSIVYRPATTGQRGTVYAIPTTKKIVVDKNQNRVELTRQSSSSLPRRGDSVIIKT